MIQPEQQQLIETAKTTADVVAVGGTVAALVQWLPPIAAGVSIIWLSTRIFEYARWVRRGRKGKEGQ